MMLAAGVLADSAQHRLSQHDALVYEVPMTNRADRIEAALRTALAPTAIEVVDDSASHAGHAGARAGGQTHYNLLVVSAQFEGLNRVARHRLVNQALGPEFDAGLHALSLVLRTPAEAQFGAQGATQVGAGA